MQQIVPFQLTAVMVGTVVVSTFAFLIFVKLSPLDCLVSIDTMWEPTILV